jgi:hypothetical protein
MNRTDDEINEFIEEVIQSWGDVRIKKIVQVLTDEGIKISISPEICHSYVVTSAF